MRPLVVPQKPAQTKRATGPTATPSARSISLGRGPTASAKSAATQWAFDLDLKQCQNCGSELDIIAAILTRPVVARSLNLRSLQNETVISITEVLPATSDYCWLRFVARRFVESGQEGCHLQARPVPRVGRTDTQWSPAAPHGSRAPPAFFSGQAAVHVRCTQPPVAHVPQRYHRAGSGSFTRKTDPFV